MKKIKIFLISLLSVLMFSSCDDYLELYPDNAQSSDQYWTSKEDVAAVIGAGYVKLRGSVEYLFVWGEMRASSMDIYNAAEDPAKSTQQVKQMLTKADNRYAQWGNMYQVINMANSVLKYAPAVQDVDPSFTTEEMNGYFAEAYFLRSIAYFYLVRTFENVPFVTQPYVSDEASFDLPQTSATEILASIKADLEAVIAPNGDPSKSVAKDFYPDTNPDNPTHTKGRATKWAIYALLADISLWQEEYDDCIKYCERIIESEYMTLLSKDQWFQNFYPGNSTESIFEIQYNRSLSQTNSFVDWFYTKAQFVPSENTVELFNRTSVLGDVRGGGATLVYSSTPLIWKYLGIDIFSVAPTIRASTNFDQNFIIYRLAEIHMMKAEAHIMKGQSSYLDAMAEIKIVRDRAGIVETLLPYSTEYEMLAFLYDEKVREFCGEGKAWFDLLRIAKSKNYTYKEFLIRQVTLTTPTNMYGVIRSKLSNNGSHYLPIHRNEINANGLLRQNQYYKDLGYDAK